MIADPREARRQLALGEARLALRFVANNSEPDRPGDLALRLAMIHERAVEALEHIVQETGVPE